MAVELQDVKLSLSETLEHVAKSVPEGKITIRDLFHLVGEQGLILLIMILTIPFLTPLPLPGVSTVFGALIMLISLGVILNRIPWMPGIMLRRTVHSDQLVPVLERGAALMRRVERFIRPRLLALSGSETINRLHGFMLFFGGFLLIIPLPVLPLSNFLPGWGLLLLGAGILQRDGYFIIAGYILNIVTFVYFGLVFLGVLLAGGSLIQLFREPTPMPTPTPGLIWLWITGLLR
ncbi:MAG: exopolysaccharide biosynthesis protein [Anaerolinea sp.]|nr:exopolysaccharide biosynthesis protein [Anaerolinea sp.]CAG1014053.1 hypothetical protein ANRL4_05103 [Anaerolineae bacterium]